MSSNTQNTKIQCNIGVAERSKRDLIAIEAVAKNVANCEKKLHEKARIYEMMIEKSGEDMEIEYDPLSTELQQPNCFGFESMKSNYDKGSCLIDFEKKKWYREDDHIEELLDRDWELRQDSLINSGDPNEMVEFVDALGRSR